MCYPMKYVQKCTIFRRYLLLLQKTPYQFLSCVIPIFTMSNVLVGRALVRGKRTLAMMSRSSRMMDATVWGPTRAPQMAVSIKIKSQSTPAENAVVRVSPQKGMCESKVRISTRFLEGGIFTAIPSFLAADLRLECLDYENGGL